MAKLARAKLLSANPNPSANVTILGGYGAHLLDSFILQFINSLASHMGKKHKKAATVLNHGPYSTLCMAVAKLTHVENFIFLNFKAINNPSSRYFLHLKLSHSTRGMMKSQGEKLVAQFRQWFSESPVVWIQ